MNEPIIIPRKPWLAATLAATLPGFGQLYNGELNRGIFLFLAFAFLSIPFVAIVALNLPAQWTLPLLALSVLTSLGLYLYGIVDAWRTARRSPAFCVQPWQQPAIYVLLFLGAYFLVLGGAFNYVREHLVESFYIAGNSMTPGLLRGDIVFADKRVNCNGCRFPLRRGDIAVFVYPNDRTRMYVKRVIALPGDRVELAGGELRVNGQPLAEGRVDAAGLVTERSEAGSWQVRWSGESATRAAALTVPPGELFVLGDDRSGQDSRDFGTVPLRDVAGLARQIWFSYTRESGMRWERLGRVL